MRTNRVTTLLAAACSLAVAVTARADDSPVGTKAGEWHLTDWHNTKPLALRDLSGKVVLVRWWTAPGCPFCAATAPALNEFHKEYAGSGLVVVGVYHHKSDAPLDPDKVKQAAKGFSFEFPVAIDRDWKTLKQWWLGGGRRRWTSVSFLIDRHGVVRHVHPGGQYVKGDDDYTTLKAKIEELLNEK